MRSWSGDDLRQAEFLANGVEAWVATKRRHFRVSQQEPHTLRHRDSRPVQRLERAIVVPQRGIDHRQTERVVMRGGQSFDFRAAAGQDIRVSHPMLHARLRSPRLQHT